RPADAEQQLRLALASAPDNPESHRALAAACIAQGRVEDAITAYRDLLKLRPDDADALVNIAWIRATHADPAHRDGAEPLQLGQRARAATPEPNAVVLSTLAAAWAETGRFPEALADADSAVALAQHDGDQPSVEHFKEQRAAYAEHRAFHFRS